MENTMNTNAIETEATETKTCTLCGNIIPAGTETEFFNRPASGHRKLYTLCEECAEIPVCYICGEPIENPDDIRYIKAEKEGEWRDDIPVCLECYENETVTCERCGNKIHDDESYLALDGRRRRGNESLEDHAVHLCGECYNEEVWTCDCCGDEIYSDNMYGNPDEAFCEHCVRSGFVTECQSCQDYFQVEDMTSTDDGLVCEHCLEEYYTRCCDCGEYFQTENMEYDEYSDEYFCSDCHRNQDREGRMDRCCNCYSHRHREDLTEIKGRLYCQRCAREHTENFCELCGADIKEATDKKQTPNGYICKACADKQAKEEKKKIKRIKKEKDQAIYLANNSIGYASRRNVFLSSAPYRAYSNDPVWSSVATGSIMRKSFNINNPDEVAAITSEIKNGYCVSEEKAAQFVEWLDDMNKNGTSCKQQYGYHENSPRTYYKLNDEDTDLYFGIELEVETRRTMTMIAEAHDIINRDKLRRMRNMVDFCRDGSVDGFEMVFQPMTYRFLREQQNNIINRTLEYLRDNGGRSDKASGSCGLHIHASRLALQLAKEDSPIDDSKYRITKGQNALILQQALFREEMEELSRRREDYNYAEPVNYNWESEVRSAYNMLQHNGELEKEMKLNQWINDNWVYYVRDRRYGFLNIQNANTIELRMFRGTLNPESFWAAIDFWKYQIDIALNKSLAEIIEMSVDDYISGARNVSAELDGYISRRLG